MGNDASHGAMLASVPRSITQALQATERLCAKKDMIFDKFDKLLNKMGAESFDRNQTDAAAEMAKDETMKAWLEAEGSAGRREVRPRPLREVVGDRQGDAGAC